MEEDDDDNEYYATIQSRFLRSEISRGLLILTLGSSLYIASYFIFLRVS